MNKQVTINLSNEEVKEIIAKYMGTKAENVSWVVDINGCVDFNVEKTLIFPESIVSNVSRNISGVVDIPLSHCTTAKSYPAEQDINISFTSGGNGDG